MLWHEFLQQCGQPGVFTSADDKLSSSSTSVVVNAATTSFKKLKSLADVPLLVYNWDNDPDKELQFGFQVCHKRKDLKSGPLAPEPGVDYSLDSKFRYLVFYRYIHIYAARFVLVSYISSGQLLLYRSINRVSVALLHDLAVIVVVFIWHCCNIK
jgi:hypothetical protein